MNISNQSQTATATEDGGAHMPLFPSVPVTLGDYTLTQRLGSHEQSESYIARQSHVERCVVLELLRPAPEPDGGERAEQFRRMARARVAARLPHVVPVLEASTSPEEYCYICQALPDGSALSSMAAEGRQLTVQQACDLISAAGKLCAAAGEAGYDAALLTSDRVFLNRSEQFSFLSPILADAPTSDSTARQLRNLAQAILPVRPTHVPGEGRLSTLLTWMQDGYEGEALDWLAITSTAGIIAEQLRPQTALHINAPQHYDQGRAQRADKRRRRDIRKRNLLIAAAFATILSMGAAGVYLAPASVEPVAALRGGYVHCREGEGVQKVAAQPVNVAQYHQFLEGWNALDAARRGSLTQDIPPEQSDPTPGDWETQLAASDGSAPVTQVSYWQALMYARWQRASLPTATLLAAARAEAGHPGIEEWTQQLQLASPPYAMSRLVLPAEAGASPIPESDPAARNPQRGFRICP